MSRIHVCSAQALPEQVPLVRPSHLISLGVQIDTPIGMEPMKHLLLAFADIIDITPRNRPLAPTAHHVQALIELADRWDGDTPMMIHCNLGQSRSPAGAYIVSCLKNPAKEHRCAQLLREQAPHCKPNRLMVGLADQILGRQGRMVEAIAQLGDPVTSVFSGMFSLPLHID